MEGVELSSLAFELHKVNRRFEHKPSRSIRNICKKLGVWSVWADAEFGSEFSFQVDYYKLPLQAFAGFSFDELCKLYYSPFAEMSDDVTKLFKTDVRYEIIRKIKNSMWRWGLSEGTWNEVVDAYNNIRRFSFINDGCFEARLSYTTSYNECGHSKFGRAYLDGVFGFLIYHKNKHVLTVGFSIIDGRRLLVQQIQMTQRKGNRWLYALPSPYVEYVIERMRENFPGYDIWIVDGKSLAKKILGNYRQSLAKAQRIVGRSLEDQESCSVLRRKIAHLKQDTPRLAALYGNVGRFKLGKPLSRNGLRHLQVLTS